ncbi:MAG TPA: hypothetical protein VHL98_11330 [Microvirga sp.]|jgi:hypothetical protein|nr:hypothetical protein [Microvirga sp.]
MIRPRTLRILGQSLVVLALASALLGGVRALTGTASASSRYIAPAYGSPMLDMGDAP